MKKDLFFKISTIAIFSIFLIGCAHVQEKSAAGSLQSEQVHFTEKEDTASSADERMREDAPAFKHYDNPQQGISFDYPAHWTLSENDYDTSEFHGVVNALQFRYIGLSNGKGEESTFFATIGIKKKTENDMRLETFRTGVAAYKHVLNAKEFHVASYPMVQWRLEPTWEWDGREGGELWFCAADSIPEKTSCEYIDASDKEVSLRVNFNTVHMDSPEGKVIEEQFMKVIESIHIAQ